MVQGSIRRMWFLYVLYFLEIGKARVLSWLTSYANFQTYAASSVASFIIVRIGLINEGVVSLPLFIAIDVMQACAPVFAALTSSVASYIICRVILASTNTEYDLPSRGRFKQIVHITIHTAVLYTGCAVLNAVSVIAAVLSTNPTVEAVSICISDANPAITVSYSFCWLCRCVGF